jgi:hypothetical protein
VRVDESACSVDLLDAVTNMRNACLLTTSTNAQVQALGQGACISGAAAVAGSLSSCDLNTAGAQRRGHTQELAAVAGATATVSLQDAQACASAVAGIQSQINAACDFNDFDRRSKRDDCGTAEQAALSAVTGACPAVSVSGDDAKNQLNSAGDSGAKAGRLDEAVGEIAALPPA